MRRGTERASPPLRVVPDGSADIIWRHDGRSVATLVAGPDTEAQLAPLAAGSRMIGIRFAPGAADAVLGISLDELCNLRVPLGELWGPAAEDLSERVALSAQPELALATAVRRRITAPPDPTASAIARRLEFATGPGVVSRLAVDLGVSERQLHRRCRTAFGYGPKMLQRVLRFQRALRLARAGGRLADVAAIVGYADQAHMARDTRRLAGAPLSDLLSEYGVFEPSQRERLES
jgi:AraC-like DNA-binding protein